MYTQRKYQPDEVPEHFRDLAFAYLDAAHRLCKDMVDGSWPGSYERGQVTLWLVFHASELFLKGCIFKATKQVKKNHSLAQLTEDFHSTFPHLSFDPPFGTEPPPDIDGEVTAWVYETDKTMHEQLRYPIDNSGRQWGGPRGFSADGFMGDIEELRSQFVQIAEAVYAPAKDT
jgi:hypothetical protein